MNVEHAQLSMNIFDAIVLGIFGLSAIVAFFRGFVREVLSLGAWVGAALITVYLFPQSTQFMKAHVKSEHVAAGAAALGTYFCALITLSLINSIIIRYLKTGAEVGIIDNALGFVFGGIRGAFVVSLAFLIMSSVVPKDNPPLWLKNSVTKPYLQHGAEVLASIAPRYLSNLEDIVKKQKETADAQRNGQDPLTTNSQAIDRRLSETENKASHDMHSFMRSLQRSEQEGTQNANR